jgi:hypothetical protein
LYKSNGQPIKSEVYPREVRGLNDGVDDTMAVTAVLSSTPSFNPL